MMKKFICLMLALIMAVMALTSCSGDEDAVNVITDEASRATTTLNMWMVTESTLIAKASERLRTGWDPDNLTAEQEAEFKNWPAEERDALIQFNDISKAINKLTKAKYKTKLNLVMVADEDGDGDVDEYYAKLEKAYADRQVEVKEEQSILKEEQVGATELNEHGIPELKYPDASVNQVDILFIGNHEKYRDYADQGMLVALDTHLQDSAIQLSYYINQIYIQAAKYNGVVSAIPNNGKIGEYTYLCVKDTVLNENGYSVSEFSKQSVYDNKFYEFLSLIQQNNAGLPEEEKIYPIYTDNASGKLEIGNVHYWNFDVSSVAGNCILNENVFSLYGGVYDNVNSNKGALTTCGDYIRFDNLLSNESFMNNYLARKVEYETEGFITTDPDANAAVCVVTGDWSLQEEYAKKGYRVLMMENPRATTSAVFDSMFAVSELSNDETRAMEIITYLNTDVEFRNLLQYGLENVNYTLNPVVKKTDGMDAEYYYVTETENNLYKMDVKKTGNEFIAYPTTEEGIDELEYGKMQNLDATMYPTLGLYFDLKTFKLDTQSIRVINAISPYIEAKLNSLATAQEVRETYDTFKNPTSMADALLAFIGNANVTYVNDAGETKTVTKADLTAALNGFTAAFKEVSGSVQSPFGLYTNWRSVNGFT